MGKFAREKGKRGESEVRKLIESYTGVKFRRRGSEQSENGGYDLQVDLDACPSGLLHIAKLLDSLAIEVKNTSDGYQPTYMKQCLEQATKYNRTGVLIYKVPLKGFRVAIHAMDFSRIILSEDEYDYEADEILHMLPQTFLKLVGLYNPVVKEKQ